MAKPTGSITLVHAALRDADLTARQIAAQTGMTARQVSNAMQSARRTNGTRKVYVPIYIVGYIRDGSVKQPIYSLKKKVTETVARKSTLPTRYVAPFREMTREDYDIWSHRDMAVSGR